MNNPRAASKCKTPKPFRSRLPALSPTSGSNRRPVPRYGMPQDAFQRTTPRHNPPITTATSSNSGATSSHMNTEGPSVSSVQQAGVPQAGDAATDITSSDGTLDRIIDNYAGASLSNEQENPFLHADLLNRRSFVENREEDLRLQSIAPWNRHLIPGTSYARERNYTLSSGPAPDQPLPPLPAKRAPPTPLTRTIRQVSNTDTGLPTPPTGLLDRVRGPVDFSSNSVPSSSLNRPSASSGNTPYSSSIRKTPRRPDTSVPGMWRGCSPTRTARKNEMASTPNKGKSPALSPPGNSVDQRNSWATVVTETNQSDWETMPGSVANFQPDGRFSTVPPLPSAFASTRARNHQRGPFQVNEEASRSSDSISTTGFFDLALQDGDEEDSPVVKDVAARKHVQESTSSYSLFPNAEHTPTISDTPRRVFQPQSFTTVEATSTTHQTLKKKMSTRIKSFARGVIVDPRKPIPAARPSRPLVPPGTFVEPSAHRSVQSSVSATPQHLEPSSVISHSALGDSRYPTHAIQSPTQQVFRNFSHQSRTYRTYATRRDETYEMTTVLAQPPTSARREGKQPVRDLPSDGSAPTLASVATNQAQGDSQFDSSERLVHNGRRRRFLGNSRLGREVYRSLDEERKLVYGKRLSSFVFALCVPLCFPGLLFGNGYLDDLLIRLTHNEYARPSENQKKWAMMVAWAQFSVICTGLII